MQLAALQLAKMVFQLHPTIQRKFARMKHNRQTIACVSLLVGVIIVIFLYSRTGRSVNPSVTFDDHGREFVVKGRKMRLLSGSIHYFRVIPNYWEDRMEKLKAMGLNTVDTYVAWNMHEPKPGQFDFTGILDIKRFIETAQRLGLNVIVRPGPYICAEWDNGGLPSWLLHDPHMRVRTTYPPYQAAVERFFTRLFTILKPLQVAYGGPIIAFQVENEYAQATEPSRGHMVFLYELMRRLGGVELFITSDGGNDMELSKDLLPDDSVLMTVNFQSHIERNLNQLLAVQPNKPVLVMEFWPGWFDHWGHPHLDRDVPPDELIEKITEILQAGGSFNLYMFHGGTNFGFMNGANIVDMQYRPDVTSYDYNAPLSEAGDVTVKYSRLRKLLVELTPDSIPMPLPNYPLITPKGSYGEVELTLYLKLVHSLDYAPMPDKSDHVTPMEALSVNDHNGQSYGYTLYRTVIPSTSDTVTISLLKDHGVLLFDYEPVNILSSSAQQSVLLNSKIKSDKEGSSILDILVENCGRVNFGSSVGERKGIVGDVLVDGAPQKAWKIYSFEFKKDFIEQITSGGLWSRTPAPYNVGPALYKGSFTINDRPQDTFLDMQGWTKGVVFINEVNLGRYWKAGPQQTLYVPGPLLKRGINRILIFEMHYPKTVPRVKFVAAPILDQNDY